MKLFKSKKKRTADLKRRVERMQRVILAAGAKAMETDPTVGPMLMSPEVQAELAALEHLTLDQAEKFLDWLEASEPEEFKGIK